ncbi:1-acyl-sn-glycerol-3-phosphate acyltransferase [Alteromonas sp. ASW11-130]|uniref:1-acyl-sn-glycerol-3-phosphate acyltransferase n=1 Tax=Alteromonas sp. ASW11-130 TaxID=3015775 RepID=UPI00224234BA|nr:1-acyl-sn-glycerol-3-phosphate acyltransferase [Alteromonas sp. ASW11-130]MCW8092460.1 1-acyl-sn-glycerol-3-phosphate acyltransferase [Alteromonas sp. ASW11-130]
MSDPVLITPKIKPVTYESGGSTVFSSLCQWLLKQMGWRAQGEMISVPKVVLSMAPHTSNWDFVLGVLIIMSMRLKVCFFGKHTLFRPPLVWFMKRIGGIPVDRSRAHGVVAQAAESIRKKQTIVLVVAPEGTRKAVYPWRKGFLHIANAAHVPVQCVGLDYKRKRLIFGPVLKIEDNIDEQMQTIYAFYATVTARYPSQCKVTEYK